jgi:hypothetical protein
MLTDKSVCDVLQFFECNVNESRSIWVLVGFRTKADDRKYSSTSVLQVAVESTQVMAPLIWAPDGAYIRILLPSVSATW